VAEEVLVGLRELTRALRALVEEYSEEGRIFTLVMLIPAEPASPAGNHTLVVSAPWLDKLSPREAVSAILKSLLQELGSTQSPGYRTLARIMPISTTDPFVATVTSAFPVLDGGVVTIQNQEINGVLVERAVLLESRSPDQVESR
jgi:hypothetical protein